MRVRLLLALAMAATAGLVFSACDSKNELRIENRTRDTLFVFGTHGGMNVTTGWVFIDPGESGDANLGGKKPDDVHFYFNYPRNADGTPANLPFDDRLRSFSCTWEQAKEAGPPVVTEGDPPCGLMNVSPP